MSNQINKGDYDWSAVGWGLLIIVIALAWFATLVGQLFGVAWFWPWLFFGMWLGTVVRVGNRYKGKKIVPPTQKQVNDVLTPNEQRAAFFRSAKVREEPRMPHLTTIPGQYTRKPCTNPSWIQIPFRREYEINCFSHVVRERATRDIIEPGYDPEGLGDGVWFNLGVKDGRNVYTKLEDIVEATFGKGHGC